MRFRSLAVFSVCLAATCVTVRADVEAAKKFLAAATELADKGENDDASAKLDLAEGSLDDVTAAEKADFQKQIAALRQKMAGATDAKAKPILENKVTRAVRDSEEAVGNMATWLGASNRLKELLDDPETTRLLGGEAVAGYRKQFATFEKVHKGKALKVNLASATTTVEELEATWKEKKADLADKDRSPEGKAQIVESLQRDIDDSQRAFKELPDDDAPSKALRDRVAKISSELNSTAGDAQVDDFVKRLKSNVELYADDFKGMDAETAMPTWEQWRGESSQAMSAFKMPKTAAFISRVGGQLKDLDDNEDYKAVKDKPQVKAAVDDLTQQVAAARKKRDASVAKVVDGLEKATLDANSAERAGYLKEAVRGTLGEDSPDFAPMAARIDKKIEAFASAKTANEGAQAAAYTKLCADAAAAWPAMLAKFQTEEGFDPGNPGALKGKLIKIETDNLVGYRFKHGDFPFATTLNGLPVAGRYDAAVKKAVDDVEQKIGHALGDVDEDGKWTVVCRVEGSTGRLVQLLKHEGDVTDTGGGKVGSVSGTEERPVDAPIVTVIAAHCGPLAVSVNGDGPRSDATPAAPQTPNTPTATPAAAAAAVAGSSAAPSAASPTAGAAPLAVSNASAHAGRGIFSRLFAIVTGLFAVLLGGVALMKARFAPLATNAGAVQLTSRIGEGNQALLGFAGIGWGGLAVLMSLLAIAAAFVSALIGIVAGLAMVVSGFVVSSDAPALAGVVKPDLAAKIKSFAVPAGLTCAALGVIGLLMALIP